MDGESRNKGEREQRLSPAVFSLGYSAEKRLHPASAFLPLENFKFA